MVGRMKLRTKIVVLLIVILAISLPVEIFWSRSQHEAQAEQEMLEKAQILVKQLNAIWEFMDDNQALIDTDADGTYNFKGLNCVIAGKQISSIFSEETNYRIRYTNTTTRKSTDSPDEFEKKALKVFNADHSLTEYYALFTEDEPMFRYAAPIWFKESCMDCHGEPAGEIDALGYPKEGMRIDDLAGIVSVQMPVSLYLSGVQNNIIQQCASVFLLILVIVLVVYLAFTGMVIRPLASIERAAEQIQDGNYTVTLNKISRSGEIKVLTDRFNAMAHQLNEVYSSLEEQVKARTEQLTATNEALDRQRRQLQEMNALLEKENEYRSDFLTIMSHELRTPLTSILAFIDLWKDSHEGLDETERSTIEEIRENGQLLLSMVNNILEIARAEAKGIDVYHEPLDMVDLVAVVESSMAPLAEKKGLGFSARVEPDVPIIYADREKIRRVVENLLFNAIKFTPSGGSIDMIVANEAAKNQVKIVVKDTGIGIPQEDLDAVFERFYRNEAPLNQEYGGSGLGLAVVKQLVEAHEGTVLVSSIVGGGSSFVVFLPVGGGDWKEIQ
jgi:signal transduction histidine kinase